MLEKNMLNSKNLKIWLYQRSKYHAKSIGERFIPEDTRVFSDLSEKDQLIFELLALDIIDLINNKQ